MVVISVNNFWASSECTILDTVHVRCPYAMEIRCFPPDSPCLSLTPWTIARGCAQMRNMNQTSPSATRSWPLRSETLNQCGMQSLIMCRSEEMVYKRIARALCQVPLGCPCRLLNFLIPFVVLPFFWIMSPFTSLKRLSTSSKVCWWKLAEVNRQWQSAHLSQISRRNSSHSSKSTHTCDSLAIHGHPSPMDITYAVVR